MPSPMYGSFAVVTLLVLGLLMLLARASQAMLVEPSEEPSGDTTTALQAHEQAEGLPATGAARLEQHARLNPWGENEAETETQRSRAEAQQPQTESADHSTKTLLVNVAVSQGFFGAVLLGAAWLANIPPVAFGVEFGTPASTGLPALALGVVVGLALYAANELSANVADEWGIEYAEDLREQLAPDSVGGWVLLLAVVLPIIAAFEELLFRAALVGVFSAGLGVSPWLLAVVSTLAFALGHGAQGPAGIAVTGLLGFVLAAVFIVTESLLVVVVAHYLVNALEFVVHEGLGVEWGRDGSESAAGK
ncbi:CPBP family intramembrane glutamic endopeptidase [Halorussus halophilus]|uniref:CPBP family intramembrane glutamic endopeptidase n=1 Tax=Halorussus halophilus TaxID=2650975 RepID=UPI0013015D9D|nr:CPBP family intramembrane glutamic endopeptidase [Halorussus halophilus]